MCQPGASFSAGDELGTISTLEGEVVEVVRAPGQGIVISWMDGGWVVAGGVTGTLGLVE